MSKIIEGALDFQDFRAAFPYSCEPLNPAPGSSYGDNTFEKRFEFNFATGQGGDTTPLTVQLTGYCAGRLEIEFNLLADGSHLLQYARMTGLIATDYANGGILITNPEIAEYREWIGESGSLGPMMISLHAGSLTSDFPIIRIVEGSQVLSQTLQIKARVLGFASATGEDLNLALSRFDDEFDGTPVPYRPSGTWNIDWVGGPDPVTMPPYVKTAYSAWEDCGSGTLSITLQPAASYVAGETVYVKDLGGDAINWNIAITPAGGDTIDNGAEYSVTIALGMGYIALMSDGVSNWSIVSFSG